MPLTRCEVNGKGGWKWGNAGHCYPGPGGKKLAIKQGLAEGGGKLDAFIYDELDDSDFDGLIGDTELPFITRAMIAKAKVLTTKKRNSLKDSDFAIIVDGKRMFPIHDASHVRNALSRINESNLTPAQKKEALEKIHKAAKKFGIDKAEAADEDSKNKKKVKIPKDSTGKSQLPNSVGP